MNVPLCVRVTGPEWFLESAALFLDLNAFLAWLAYVVFWVWTLPSRRFKLEALVFIGLSVLGSFPEARDRQLGIGSNRGELSHL